VPLPAVPGTNHFISFDQALPQGAASVQADVVHGRDSSVHVGYAYYSVTQGKFFGFALGGKVGLSGKFYEVGHETFLNYESALPSGARPGQPGRLSPRGLGLTTEDRRLFRLQRLRDHHLALEILHHVGIEAYFGGTLGQGHLIDLVLQLEQRIEQIFRTRRAADHVDIRGDDLVHALQDRISIKWTAYRRACAHRDHPLGIGHLVVDTLHHRRHFQSDGAGDDHQVTLPGARTKDFRAEAGNVEAGRRRSDHLDSATGQSKRHWPNRRL